MRIFSNLAISLDGKIADRVQPSQSLGTAYDKRMMQVIRAQSQAIIVGSQTLKASPKPMKTAKAKRQPLNIVVAQSSSLRSLKNFWQDDAVKRLILTTESSVAKYTRESKDRALVKAFGKKNFKLAAALKFLKKEMAIESLLVEGGGELMSLFLRENYLQELYLTLTPRILGGRENPSLVGGLKAIPGWRNLKLLKHKKVKDEVYFHYQVKKHRRI